MCFFRLFVFLVFALNAVYFSTDDRYVACLGENEDRHAHWTPVSTLSQIVLKEIESLLLVSIKMEFSVMCLSNRGGGAF